jgi:predicted nuclease of restriction endonuclease-like (RecB) superfamily
MNESERFEGDYQHLLTSLSAVIENSRKMSAQSVNKIMTEACSKIGIDTSGVNQNTLNPLALRFLGLKDDFAGKAFKESLLIKLEDFFFSSNLGFTVVGKNKKFQIGDDWYRVDLVLFNRRLRCLVIIDLKIGKLTHADIGQMLLYTGYADRHWREAGENPPVGLILCDQKNDALARYTLESLPNKILASEYKMTLPSEEVLAREIVEAKRFLSARGIVEK